MLTLAIAASNELLKKISWKIASSVVCGTLTGLGLLFPLTIHSDYSNAPQVEFIQKEVLSDDSPTEKIKEAIVKFAVKYGAEKSHLMQTIACESSFRQSARGAAGEIGLAQFMPMTWKYFNSLRGTDLDIHNIEDQLDMTAWAFSEGYQTHWSCWKNIYLAN